ncbi:MAG: glycosyltransferase family 4 protein [Pyrinomonadaceae bacterium]
MRILHVSSSRTFGGGERHVADLTRGLSDRGHEVFVALRPTNEWQHRLSFLPPANIMHVSIRNSFGVLSSMRIADFVRLNKIDIVHAHVARDYIPASIAVLAVKDARFVLTRHVLFPLKPFNKFALKNLSAAIGVSDAVGSGLKKVFPAGKISVIKNGLNVAPMEPEDESRLRREFREFHQLPLDATVIGTLGELIELKGQRDFVLAAHEITKQFPDCHFVIVGKDNSADRKFRRELRRLVKVFGLDDRFLWLDWIDDTDSFFAATDIFVSPSHSESFGLAMLEAMMHGRPVVATETEGARELFGKSAPLAKMKDPIDLAAKVSELIADDKVRVDRGTDNRKSAGEKFSLERMLDETEKLYKKLIA